MSPRGHSILTVVLVAPVCGAATSAQAGEVPTLVWSTYYDTDAAWYGSDSLAALATVEDGVVVMQEGFDESRGAALARFDAAGQLVWSSFYGGDGEAGDGRAQGVASAPELGLLYLVGGTTFDSGIATPGAHQSYRECFGHGAACAEEGFVAQFDATGSLRWGTYFGGPFDERIYGASADASGALYVCGVTESRTGVATSGTPPPALDSRPGGFLARFDVDGSLRWATYTDHAYVTIAADPGGDGVVVAGDDAMMPGSTSEYDAHVARFNGAGEPVWASDFGGEDNENVARVVVDATGAAYVVGDTLSRAGIGTPDAHQVALGGSGDAFIAKFTVKGALEWSTYFGGAGYEFRPAAALDDDGNLYVGASTYSADIATAGEPSAEVGEHGDVVLARFGEDGALAWAIYYGGEGTEEVRGLAVDAEGGIYVGGQTNSTAGIATEGAIQAELVDGLNNFLAMFRETP